MPLRALIIAILLSAICPSFSLAQIPLFSTSKDKDVTIDRAEFGFAGTVAPEAWTPITVWITGGPRGFSGAMVVQFEQDDTQPASIVVPASATPGVSVPVEAVACLPLGLDSISITMIDQSRRSRAQATFSRFPTGRERQLIADTVDDQSLVVCIGRTSAARAFPDPRYITYSPPTGTTYYNAPAQRPSRDLVAALLPSDRMLLSWPAYCGAEAVILEAESLRDPDPRALEALRTWVSGGGRLILVAGGPGGLWRRLLPPGPPGDLVELDETARHAVGPDLARAVRAAESLRRPDGSVFAIDAARRNPQVEHPSSEFQGAPTISGRLVRPTGLGAACGWTTRWSPDGGAGSGLLAEGPAGLGWVTILGIDPELAAAAPSRQTTAAVWGDAIRVALALWLERTTPAVPDKNNPNQFYMDWDYQNSRSAPDLESRQALTGALNQLATIPPLGGAVFWGIAICLAALALLIGPFDGFVLRRFNLRHFSWLTALAWIGLASAGAYFVPTAIRSGNTAVNRVAVIDSVQTIGAPTAWQTGLTGIFAAARGEMKLSDANPASWWRGVSSRPWNRWEQRRVMTFPPLTTVQSDAGHKGRAAVPESIWQGQWTFRTFQDDGPLAAPLSARVVSKDGRYEVRVHGLGADASITSAALRLRDTWLALAVAVGPRAGLTMTSAGPASPGDWVDAQRADGRPVGIHALVLPIIGLPGPRQRSDAIDAYVRSGAYAAVYLRVAGGPPAPGVDVPADYERATVVRLVVPVEPIDGQSPDQSAEPQGTAP